MSAAQLTSSRSRLLTTIGALMLALGAIGSGTTSATINSGPRAVFVPITPCRLIDTRPAPDTVGARTAPLASGETITIQVTGTNGNCTIPSDAAAVAANVVAVQPSHSGFVTLWPADVATRPLTANLNFVAGAPPTPNKVDVKLSPDGRMNAYNFTGTTHLVVDVFGYYADHAHDDRYAQIGHTHPHDTLLDVQTIQLPATSLIFEHYPTPTAAGFTNGCIVAFSGGTIGRVPLPVPVGARIAEVRVRMFDYSTATAYSVVLHRLTTNASGLSAATLGTAVGGAAFLANVEHVIVPLAPEIVSPTSTYQLQIGLGAALTNGLCSVSITYDLTP